MPWRSRLARGQAATQKGLRLAETRFDDWLNQSTTSNS